MEITKRTVTDTDISIESEKYDSEEYFKDENNCAEHQRVCEALLNMPDLLVVEIIMNWAREKKHNATVEFTNPISWGKFKHENL